MTWSFEHKFKLAAKSNIQAMMVSLLLFFSFTGILCQRVFAATVTRTNSSGNLFLVKLDEDEKLESGDKVFVVYDGQLKTTGLIKFEGDGTVSVRVKNPLNMVRNGDFLQLSHDQNWIMKGDGKNQLVTGIVGKVAGDKIYIKMDEKFQPAFGLKQPAEIQVDETLQVVPAVAIEYRAAGIWFKATGGDVKKLTEGLPVSFPPPPRSDFGVTTVRKKFRDGATSFRVLAGAQQMRVNSDNSYNGFSVGLFGVREISLSETIYLPLGLGLNYYKLQRSDDGFKFELTQSSVVVHMGASFRLGRSFIFGPFFEYQSGLDGYLSSSFGSEKTVGDHKSTAIGGGLLFAFQLDSSRSMGVEFGSLPTKSKVNFAGNKTSGSARATTERLFLSFAF